jgi:hypothetical protein
MKRLLAILLVPLSALPFVVIVPAIVDSHERFVRTHQMGPLPAPSARLDERFRTLPAHPGRVPVLAWHGIGDGPDEVPAGELARQLQLLKALGYESISAADWARMRAGDRKGLPKRPVLLTIDGGKLDSYRRADDVLRRTGMRATMFVQTGPTEDGDPSYLRWSELRRMRESGRWDVQPGAHRGYATIATGPRGQTAPFYVARRWTRSDGLETRAAWERRVAGDLFALRSRFAVHGIAPAAIAVPYGDIGRRTTNDRALPRLLSGLLERQFGNWFTQVADADFTRPGHGRAERYALDRDTRPADLYRWLRRHST